MELLNSFLTTVRRNKMQSKKSNRYLWLIPFLIGAIVLLIVLVDIALNFQQKVFIRLY